MKKLAITILGSLLLGACSEEELETKTLNEISLQTINGTWKVESFEDLVTNEVTTRTEENSWGFDVVITFDDSTKPYEITGKVTTNTVFGKFSYESNNTIEVQNLGTTLISQPEWGNMFNSAFNGILEFEVNATNLVIYNDDRQKSVTLTSSCEEYATVPVCQEMVPENEECRAFFERWFYSPETSLCKKISYSGCSQKGFETEQECKNCKCN